MAKIKMEAHFRNNAIRNHYDTLIRGMKANKETITMQCYSSGLIPKDMLDAKLSHILDVVQDRVIADGTGNAFEKFLEILLGEASTAYLADNLQNEVEALKNKHKKQKFSFKHISTRMQKCKSKHITRRHKFDGSKEVLSSASDEEAQIEGKSRTHNMYGKHIQQLMDCSTATSGDEEDEENVLILGSISSVTQPEFCNMMVSIRNHEDKQLESEASQIADLVEHLKISTPDSNTQSYCCDHAREVEQLRLENRALQIACEEKIQMERNRLHLKLKLTRWERRERSQKLKEQLRSLRTCLKGSLSREAELTKELCYMDIYYTEAKAQNSQLVHRMQQEQERVTYLQQKCSCMKKRYSGMEAKLAQVLEERQRYRIAKQELEDEVKELEREVDKLKKKDLSLKEEEKEDNKVPPKIFEDEQKSLDNVLSQTL